MCSFPLDKGGRGVVVLFGTVELILGFTIDAILILLQTVCNSNYALFSRGQPPCSAMVLSISSIISTVLSSAPQMRPIVLNFVKSQSSRFSVSKPFFCWTVSTYTKLPNFPPDRCKILGCVNPNALVYFCPTHLLNLRIAAYWESWQVCRFALKEMQRCQLFA